MQDYYGSANHLRMSPSTQRNYQLVIDRLVRDEIIAHRLVAQMTRQHVQQIIGRRAAMPGAAHDLLKKIRILLHFAIDNGWRKDDPTLRPRTLSSVSSTRGQNKRSVNSRRIGRSARASGLRLRCWCLQGSRPPIDNDNQAGRSGSIPW